MILSRDNASVTLAMSLDEFERADDAHWLRRGFGAPHEEVPAA